MRPAIVFEPDGYLLDGPKLMGRQSAGNGFLRAAVAAREEETLICVTPSRESANVFQAAVSAMDPVARTEWIPAHRLDLLAHVGLLYRPDVAVAIGARPRMRVGAGAYSVCGVTHTLSSEAAMTHITNFVAGPVMPWDALICTSTVAVGVVRDTMERQRDYLHWRLGATVPTPELQLPLIPLGVHADDFAETAEDKQAARDGFALDEGDVVALFAGRLSFGGKAHPAVMYEALQRVAERSGRHIVLIQAGHFINEHVERAFREATAALCPDVRAIFVDGKDFAAYAAAWRAADLFVSLADSPQETFGLTPVEAMAAGLPVVVSDWNGYKDTVRDGIDGFRIPTWAPRPGVGAPLATDFEVGASDYDIYMARTSTAVAIDRGQLVDRLSDLVGDAGLRARMGEAGRRRVRELFDWSVVYRQYQALWRELASIRRPLTAEPATAAWLARAARQAANFPDPFDAFRDFATAHVDGQTIVTSEPGASVARFHELCRIIMLSFFNPPEAVVARLLDALAAGPREVAALAATCGYPEDRAIEAVARMAKLGLVRLAIPGS